MALVDLIRDQLVLKDGVLRRKSTGNSVNKGKGSSIVKLLPPDFHKHTLLKKFLTTDAEGNLYRVEVRKDPATGLTLKAKFKIEG